MTEAQASGYTKHRFVVEVTFSYPISEAKANEQLVAFLYLARHYPHLIACLHAQVAPLNKIKDPVPCQVQSHITSKV